ncbi:RNA polymerase ECF-type sigma factor [hydrothermal vent metagenome]|uniref:RNA polymerase ECF-type sigma factor n=1 Tax=hydrothermal vent metagenome TaxID=652676 RepID=A0A3B0W0Z1_9ZZZZ
MALKLTEQQFLAKLEDHKGILHKVSRIYFDEREDQQDLFQEIILQLWKSKTSFKGNSQFSTWIYQVAINTAMVFFKKEKRKPKQLPLIDHDAEQQPEYSGGYEQQLQLFYRAVQHLNKLEKALIFLYLEGRSGEQMAKTMGLSANHVRVKLNRIKLNLKHLLEVENNEI